MELRLRQARIKRKPWGYTIVETFIFLAVSGGLFVVTATLMSGQQAKTEFAQAIREIESQIQVVINDVSTGYYAKLNNFQCTAPPGGGAPRIDPVDPTVPDTQGTNKDCIYIGRAVQFTIGEEFNVYDIVGRRNIDNPATGRPEEVQGFTQAQPEPIGSPETKLLLYGLKVKKMRVGGGPDIGTVAFFSSFGKYEVASPGSNPDLISGAQTVNLVPLRRMAWNTSLNDSSADVQAKIRAIDDGIVTDLNPSGGIVICLESAGTRQFGIITIGSNGRQLSTKLEIRNNAPGVGDCGT